MTEEKRRILADKDLRPAYYDNFACLAADCKFSCCKGWSITFNKKDYLSLKRERGSDELNKRLDGGLKRLRHGPMAETFYGEFNMSSGVCPLLQEDGLCKLQIEKGHGALPYVCRSYPRGRAYMPSGYLERSLSPSCEGVLKLLWELPEGVEFSSDPLPKEAHKWVNFSDEASLSPYFPAVREWCIDTLQNRRFTLPQRIFLMGLGLKELADGERDMERWITRAAALPESINASELIPNGERELAMFLSDCLHTILLVQTADREMQPIKQQLLDGLQLRPHENSSLVTIPLAPYREATARFQEAFSGHDYFMENLMVSIFFHLNMPNTDSPENLWKSYVNFCNLYAIYRFMAVMSCRSGAAGDKDELFRLMLFASRALIHNRHHQGALRDELFQNESATLAHMSILLCG